MQLGIQLDTIHGLPEITPNDDEYVIKSSENFSLNCKSKVPLVWSYPQIESQLERESLAENPNILNVESKYSREGDLYVANLEITNATELNVGYYYCNETDHPENFASLYLYVEDDTALAVGWKEIIVVNGKHCQPLIIPCRPTSPSVDVKLYSGVGADVGNEVGLLQLQKEGSDWTYQRMVGYTWAYVSNEMQRTFTCLFMRNHIIQTVVVIVNLPTNGISSAPILVVTSPIFNSHPIGSSYTKSKITCVDKINCA
ncbi:hypothetical protein QE152_g37662 [Popillia japonica]|uniref:Ig-like domain-containing protein n=1 Tax=Popillia japonica TaxID=7064 RepID=A0AAW1I918_POPJA